MDLDLVHGGHRAGLSGEPLEVGDLEVGDADRASPAVALELLQHLPGRHVVAVVPGGQRPMDDEQVDVVEAQLGERRVEGAARVVCRCAGVAELARDEDLIPR